jgi:hypothetical protein
MPSKVRELFILSIATLHIPLSPTQHGYRVHHSTTTLLTYLMQHVLDGIKTIHPIYCTLLITININVVFNATPSLLLTDKIYNTSHDTRCWLANYLTGRQ